jgi:hypothetical protein
MNLIKHVNKLWLSIIFLFLIPLSGCDLISKVFEAGVWIGILLTVVVIGLIIWLIIKLIKKV